MASNPASDRRYIILLGHINVYAPISLGEDRAILRRVESLLRESEKQLNEKLKLLELDLTARIVV